jgi:hypothetical protein
VLEGVGICIGMVAVGVVADGEGKALNALTAAGLIACGLTAGAAWPAAVPGTGRGRDKGTLATGLTGWLLFNGGGVERAAKEVLRVTFGLSLPDSPGDLFVGGLKNICGECGTPMLRGNRRGLVGAERTFAGLTCCCLRSRKEPFSTVGLILALPSARKHVL